MGTSSLIKSTRLQHLAQLPTNTPESADLCEKGANFIVSVPLKNTDRAQLRKHQNAYSRSGRFVEYQIKD